MTPRRRPSRRRPDTTFFVPFLLLLLLLPLLFVSLPATTAEAQERDERERPDDPETRDREPAELSPLNPEVLGEAQKLFGLEFTREERELILDEETAFVGPETLRQAYRALRASGLDHQAPPALHFRPEPPRTGPEDREPRWSIASPGEVERPERLEEVAFWPVTKLAALIRTGQVTSEELTRMYLDRLRRHDSELRAVITLTEERALDRARQADRELAEGRYRGPLHGIPWGAKDLLATPDYLTTWGARPYRDQVIDETATAVARMDSAGAVLVAKLSLGALAWGDVWFADTTRNPWDTEQGSSGSSAGSAAAVSAGLVPVAIGSETLGSIVSPSTRTGVTGHRPSFGTVSRHGAMVVAWSLDKLGPLCRHVEDCALVHDAVRGPDGLDPTVVDVPFPYDPDVDVSGLRVGYAAGAFEGDYPGAEADRRALETLRELGVELEPLEFPELPVQAMAFILGVEAATAHDDLTRSGRDRLLVRQEAAAWPNVFRASRYVTAVEFLQANQLRAQAGREMAERLEELDAYVSPSFAGPNLLLTNMTGHPCVVVPNGDPAAEEPNSFTVCAPLYGDATALALARAYQEATDWHLRVPPGFEP